MTAQEALAEALFASTSADEDDAPHLLDRLRALGFDVIAKPPDCLAAVVAEDFTEEDCGEDVCRPCEVNRWLRSLRSLAGTP